MSVSVPEREVGEVPADDLWGEFLRARTRLIAQLWVDGLSPEEIATKLSLDAFSVILIHQHTGEP